MNKKSMNILLVEDNPGDVRLTQEALRFGKMPHALFVAPDGVEALAFLRREGTYANVPLPDLILLDLNLPRMDGREFLSVIKKAPEFRSIPVIILTTSQADTDIVTSYELHANCYISKPVDLDQFMLVVSVIEEFWFSIVKLPSLPTLRTS